MTDMRSILGAMAERNKMEPEEIPEGTYRADDGLLHCKVCDQPVQHRLDIGGTVHLVHCICRCDEERRKREEEEERQRRERMYIASLKANGIQEQHFYSWTFANAEQNGDIRMAQRYVSQWEKAKEQNLGLLLWGGVGTGKTYIAACIANALIEQKVPVLMTNFSKVLNQMGAMYSEDRYKYISDFSKFPLLIIDDLGVERSTEYVREQIFAIIDERYKANLPLIVTTNLTIDELSSPKDVADARIYSRLLEMCAPIQIKGSDRRQKAGDAKIDLAQQMLFESEVSR